MNKGMFQAIRAIGSEFAARLWRSAFFLATGLTVVVLPLFVWLISLNEWWWVLAVPLLILFCVGVALFAVFFALIRYVRPRMSTAQSGQVKGFVDRLQRVQELSGTPKFIILFRTIRSIAAPRSEPYLKELFETKNLKKDFMEIVRSF